ncbi:MAG: helix-turn-helix transcriptional regulator, partial [Lachnospiraceae bacterium]|nr:helix-turn-helix transcriptional regulator [Lachnospiraceae bacterium]
CLAKERMKMERSDNAANNKSKNRSNTKAEIYDRYSRRRDELGYKNAQVARLAGIGQYDLTKWKKGEYMPGAKKLLAICEVLGIDLKWLLTGEGEEVMYEDETAVQENSLLNDSGSIQQKRIAGSDDEEMKKIGNTEETEDSFYRETIEALKRLSPVKRNLIIALIAACAEDTL